MTSLSITKGGIVLQKEKCRELRVDAYEWEVKIVRFQLLLLVPYQETGHYSNRFLFQVSYVMFQPGLSNLTVL